MKKQKNLVYNFLLYLLPSESNLKYSEGYWVDSEYGVEISSNELFW